jgi:hypothetical protein
MDSVGVGLPGEGSWGGRVSIGLGGPRGWWTMLFMGGVGRGVRGSTMGQGERGSFGLGSHFVSGSTGGAQGATWGRKESPTLRGEHWGIGSVLEWLDMPSVVCNNPY